MAGLKILEPADIGQALRLSKAEGWNQTEKDWEFLINNDDNICLAADVDGKIVGTATAINYENNVAWIGMVLVDKEYRGRGLSKRLLSALFEQLKYCRSIKLDATPAGQPVYRKFGFEDEYLINRMTSDSVSRKSLPDENTSFAEPVYLKNIPEIVDLDKKVFGANRKQLIEFLFENYTDNAWMIKQNGQISGFALGREGTRFFQVGPVVASTTADAKGLIVKSLSQLEDHQAVIDILEDKVELTDWLESIGFVKHRHFIRMYRKENPYPGIPGNHYLIAGPEFG
ncbi:MAG: GNAT family N-acetyltransferase [Bacteroidales bacterium]|nr:GNAT family N-acetyltransferase [Bacteroidales bacterium]